MSKQPNPLRVHYALLTNDGNLIGPMCHRPGAWLFTNEVTHVTCKACALALGITAVAR